MSRWLRQTRFAPLGEAGQRALAGSSVTVIGVGALGSVAAELIVRAGVGRVRLVDRDVVEASNLHRTALFTDDDARQSLPKSVAAASRLRALNPAAEVEAIVSDLHGGTASALVEGADILLDGTDNYEARHVVNEIALDRGLPWVHAAVLGATAVAWPIVPGGACYACLVPDIPAPGDVPTCETAGVIGPAVHVAASVQVAEAMKILTGRTADLLPGPWTLDVWTNSRARVTAERDPHCAVCTGGQRRALGRTSVAAPVACGREAVSVPSAGGAPPHLGEIAARHAGHVLAANVHLVKIAADGSELTVFRDGRVLVTGTRDAVRARTLVARVLGG